MISITRAGFLAALSGFGLPSANAQTPPRASTAAPSGVIQKWSGTGLGRPRPFRVDGPWEIRWQSSGFIQIMAYRDGSEMPDLLANQTSAGPGTSYVPDGGTYRLVINATDRWSAEVVPAP